MSPRTGRPKAEEPKNIDVKIRFDQKSHDALMKYCEKHNMTRTDVIRKAVEMLLESEK